MEKMVGKNAVATTLKQDGHGGDNVLIEIGHVPVNHVLLLGRL